MLASGLRLVVLLELQSIGYGALSVQSDHTFHGAAQVRLSEGIVATACIVLVHHIGPASAIARELLGGVDGGAVRLARRRV